MPSTIITDFEKGSINASQYEFPGVNNKVCFFHLSQSGWCKIQEAGLASQYGTDENLSLCYITCLLWHFCQQTIFPVCLIFLLKPEIPPEANSVVTWFEENYVHGRIQRRL